jgi:Flp pilus assembly pilin Flp
MRCAAMKWLAPRDEKLSRVFFSGGGVMFGSTRKALWNENGGAMVEYALLLILISAALLTAIQGITGNLVALFQSAANVFAGAI